jgi:short-subunit dehydrogenase
VKKPPARTSQTPEEVVDAALRAVKRGKSSVISGWSNLFMMESERVLPRSFVLKTMGAIMRNHSASQEPGAGSQR